ncbi:MAG: hypothetical protein WCA20_24405, partial [Candidatus Sulfotelmatobacter sp.]
GMALAILLKPRWQINTSSLLDTSKPIGQITAFPYRLISRCRLIPIAKHSVCHPNGTKDFPIIKRPGDGPRNVEDALRGRLKRLRHSP